MFFFTFLLLFVTKPTCVCYNYDVVVVSHEYHVLLLGSSLCFVVDK
ncbi:hypothetical protein GLYMA_12G094950v4 [Glycine max]|nr:hypothetical protein GLYMA_12G094950v4 [Glycine max]KAH1142402.1 hypothetical protein GYH30_033201 [Glycine max]